MPFINSRGDFCHGVGGGFLNRNNVRLMPGGCMGWMDDDTIAFASADDIVNGAWCASAFHVPTGEIRRLSDPPFGSVVGYAGGGHAAWTLAGLHSTTGFNDRNAGLIGMGPDGSIAYKPVDQSYGPTVVRRLNGSVWQLTPNHAYDLCLLDGDRAIWTDSVKGLSVANLPIPRVLSGAVYAPQVFTLGGVLWIGYFSGEHGLVAHPLTDPSRGWALVPPGVNCWAAFRALSDSRLCVVWSSAEEQQAGQLTRLFRDVTVDPLVALFSAPPPVPVPVPPVPVPVPPKPEPVPVPVSLPNILSTVKAVRAMFPDATLTPDQAVAALNLIARQHDGFGLLRKDGGNHGKQPGTGIFCSCDWLVHKPSGLGLDAFGKGPDSTTSPIESGECVPQWGDGEPFDLSRFVAPVTVDNGGSEPDPQPAGSVGDALDSALGSMSTELRSAVATIKALEARIAALEARKPEAVTGLTDGSIVALRPLAPNTGYLTAEPGGDINATDPDRAFGDYQLFRVELHQ